LRAKTFFGCARDKSLALDLAVSVLRTKDRAFTACKVVLCFRAATSSWETAAAEKP